MKRKVQRCAVCNNWVWLDKDKVWRERFDGVTVYCGAKSAKEHTPDGTDLDAHKCWNCNRDIIWEELKNAWVDDTNVARHLCSQHGENRKAHLPADADGYPVPPKVQHV